MFRKLTSEEIDVRINKVYPTGVALLLYKDARCDMNILDETVTPFKWKRSHNVLNGSLFCTVSIYNDNTGEWISKQDLGTPSRNEAEKGQASDSFKRACFNWGIGRELYTAPFIFVALKDCNINNGKCNDKFKVSKITYTPAGNIDGLIIKNINTNKIVFTQYPTNTTTEAPTETTEIIEAAEMIGEYIKCII